MRVAVVDIGTNSTRLLVADVADGRLVEERVRETRITRLGEGVDRAARLSPAAIQRVLETCAGYREAIDAEGADRVVAVLTSAVRDAANGEEFRDDLRRRFDFDAQTISGEREARLTYRGATSRRDRAQPVLVLDIGGGSTELVVGAGEEVEFHVSTQIGSVRFTERYLRDDPPPAEALAICREAVRGGIEAAVPPRIRTRPHEGIAVAGTPTSFAAIELRLEPYDRDRVHGHLLTRASCERILGELGALPLEERRRVPGLHPERAPTIVAGGLILAETMSVFGLDAMEVSERDILEGAALEAAAEHTGGLIRIDHVQLAAPSGCEPAARDFYGGLLGLREVPKPEQLRARGGVWFELGDQEVHVGVEQAFTPARKAHPAFTIADRDLEPLARRLAAAGMDPRWDDAIPGVRRFHVADPWGNRLEIRSDANSD